MPHRHVDVIRAVARLGNRKQRRDGAALHDMKAVVGQAPLDVLGPAEMRLDGSPDSFELRDLRIRERHAAIWLRELAPALRDQLMVSSRDRALIEARAKGIDVEASLKRPFRQMLKLDVIGSAFAISLFLIIYYTAVGFFPIYFQTIFHFTQSQANALGNWNWAFNAGALAP